MRKSFIFFLFLCFLSGLFLLGINIIGTIWRPNKNLHGKNTVSYIQATRLLHKNLTNFSTDKELANFVTAIFFRSIKHYWSSSDPSLRISIFHNWPLFLKSRLPYEYYDYSWAISRGVGLCSQKAIALADFMNKQGYKTRVVCLHGHVVAETYFPDKKIMVLDSDYGVVLPFDLEYAHKHIQTVINVYRKDQLRAIDNKTILQLKRIYSNKKYDYSYYARVIHNLIKYRVVKWLVPLLLLCFPLFILFFRKFNK